MHHSDHRRAPRAAPRGPVPAARRPAWLPASPSGHLLLFFVCRRLRELSVQAAPGCAAGACALAQLRRRRACERLRRQAHQPPFRFRQPVLELPITICMLCAFVTTIQKWYTARLFGGQGGPAAEGPWPCCDRSAVGQKAWHLSLRWGTAAHLIHQAEPAIRGERSIGRGRGTAGTREGSVPCSPRSRCCFDDCHPVTLKNTPQQSRALVQSAPMPPAAPGPSAGGPGAATDSKQHTQSATEGAAQAAAAAAAAAAGGGGALPPAAPSLGDLRALFDSFDADRNGRLELQEVQASRLPACCPPARHTSSRQSVRSRPPSSPTCPRRAAPASCTRRRRCRRWGCPPASGTRATCWRSTTGTPQSASTLPSSEGLANDDA